MKPELLVFTNIKQLYQASEKCLRHIKCQRWNSYTHIKAGYKKDSTNPEVFENVRNLVKLDVHYPVAVPIFCHHCEWVVNI